MLVRSNVRPTSVQCNVFMLQLLIADRYSLSRLHREVTLNSSPAFYVLQFCSFVCIFVGRTSKVQLLNCCVSSKSTLLTPYQKRRA